MLIHFTTRQCVPSLQPEEGLMNTLRLATFLVAVTIARTAFGIEFLFGTNTTANPTVFVNVGQLKSVTLWVKRSADTGYVNHIDLNVLARSSDGGVVTAGFSVLNLYRGSDPFNPEATTWDSIRFGSNNGNGSILVTDCNAVSNTETPGLSVEGNWRQFADLVIRPTSPGTVKIFLQVGPQGMSETGGATTSTFGVGDAAVVNTPGAISEVADLTVISPAPEPGMASLLVVAGVGLAARRRRRRRR